MEPDKGEWLSSENKPGLHNSLFESEKSPIQIYRELVVGDRGWGFLFWYEVIILFSSWIPGALGLIIRKFLYKPLFKEAGRNIVFGKNLILRHPHKVSLGSNIIIDDDCMLDAKGEENEGISIGDFVTIGRFSSLVCKDGDVRIGSHVNIGTSVKIISGSGGEIEVGNNIDIGSNSYFSGGSYDYSDLNVLPSSRRMQTQGIKIKDLSWVGIGVIVLDGVTIGEKSIIGAGAVVTQDVPANTVAVGVPAGIKKRRS
jgi:acetyltransferase-like isoleucine patch superfamily enzyme